jgi:hypothetical protein
MCSSFRRASNERTEMKTAAFLGVTWENKQKRPLSNRSEILIRGGAKRTHVFQIIVTSNERTEMKTAVFLGVTWENKQKRPLSHRSEILIKGGAKRTHVFQIIVILFIFNIKTLC